MAIAISTGAFRKIIWVDSWLGANLSSESEYFSLRREAIPRSGIVRSRAASAVEGLASLLVFGGVISV